MDSSKDKGALPKLLSEAILQLCRVGMGLHGNFSIDGIICIENSDQDGPEIVVKIHEKINKGAISSIDATHNNDGHMLISSANLANVSAQSLLTAPSHPVHHEGGKTQYNQSHNAPPVTLASYLGAASKCMPSALSITSTSTAKRNESDFSYLNDSDCEILDDSTHKQLFKDLGNIAVADLGGLYDVDFGDISIKPDPARSKKTLSPDDLTTANSKASDSGSDEELKIEKLTAGRSRKPNRTRPAYRDVHGESVQVLSSEEYTRILKSEKLKRSRDKSPEFPSSKRVSKSATAVAEVQDFGNGQGQMSMGSSMVGFSGLPVQIASVHDANIASISSLPSSSGAMAYGTNIPIVGSPKHGNMYSSSANNGLTTTKVIGPLQRVPDTQIDSKPVVLLTRHKQSPSKAQYSKSLNSSALPSRRTEKKFLSSMSKSDNQSRNASLSAALKLDLFNKSNTSEQSFKIDSVKNLTDRNMAQLSQYLEKSRTTEKKPQSVSSTSSEKGLVCFDDVNSATQSKPHKCPFCTQIYDTFKQLDLHMYQTHKGNFMCPLCGKLFKQRSTRNRHIVAVHSQVKNFACSMCNATFTRIDSVKKHFLTQHPEINVPKFPYSYKRGETISRSEHALEIKHDMADTDIMYIEEHLMRAVRSEKDLTILGKSPQIVASHSGYNMAADDNETKAAVEVIALDSDDQFVVNTYTLEPATEGVVLDEVEEAELELVSGGTSNASVLMDVDEAAHAGVMCVTSNKFTSQHVITTNNDSNTPVSFSPMPEIVPTDNEPNLLSRNPSVSTGNTFSILPTDLVSRLKNADMRRFVTVIQAKNTAQDRKKIDFKETITHSSYTTATSNGMLESVEVPSMSTVITSASPFHEIRDWDLETDVDNMNVKDHTKISALSIEAVESQPVDSSQGVYAKSNIIPLKSIENCKTVTTDSQKSGSDKTESNCEVSPSISTGDIEYLSAESGEQNELIKEQNLNNVTESTDNDQVSAVLETRTSDSIHSNVSSNENSTYENSANTENADSASVPNTVEPTVYFRQVLVPTHTVELVESTNTVDSVPENSASGDTVLSPNSDMTRPVQRLDITSRNRDRSIQNIDSEQLVDTIKETNEDSNDSLTSHAMRPPCSGENAEVRTEQTEGQTGDSAEKQLCAIEISDEEMETGD